MTATPNTAALRDLLDRVEAGDASRTDFITLAANEHDNENELAYNAYHGSLDAAKALHEALRPDQPFNVHFEQHADGHYCALFGTVPDEAPKWTFATKWEAKTPLQARSLLACELRALIAAPVTANEGGV